MILGYYKLFLSQFIVHLKFYSSMDTILLQKLLMYNYLWTLMIYITIFKSTSMEL